MPFTRPEIRTILGDAHTEEIENRLMSLYLGEKDKWKDQNDSLKLENEKLKGDSEKLAEVQKELDGIKGGEDYKDKYEKEHEAFENFKTSVAEKETLAKKQSAYSKLLADEQINEKHIKDVVRLTDFSKIKLDKDGNLEGVDDLKKAIGEDWSEYKVVTGKRKQEVAKPPETGTGSGMSRAKELAQKFAQERYGVKADTGKE